jgi:hypothetical protein
MKKRDNLSDHFAKGRLLFNKKGASFADVFPTIASVNVIVEIDYRDIRGRRLKETTQFDASNLPGQFINCSNPGCSDGGFSIGEVLRKMVIEKQPHLQHPFRLSHRHRLQVIPGRPCCREPNVV